MTRLEFLASLIISPKIIKELFKQTESKNSLETTENFIGFNQPSNASISNSEVIITFNRDVMVEVAYKPLSEREVDNMFKESKGFK